MHPGNGHVQQFDKYENLLSLPSLLLFAKQLAIPGILTSLNNAVGIAERCGSIEEAAEFQELREQYQEPQSDR